MGNVDELIQQYKQEAEQLSLTPAPHVWENVDREINGGKRKKRFFIILFLLGCGLAYGLLSANFNFGKKAADTYMPATKIAGHNNIAPAGPDATIESTAASNASRPEYHESVKPNKQNTPTKPSGRKQTRAAKSPVKLLPDSTTVTNIIEQSGKETNIHNAVANQKTPISLHSAPDGMGSPKPKKEKITAQYIKRMAVSAKRLSLNKAHPIFAQPVSILPPDTNSFVAKQPVQKIRVPRIAAAPRKPLTINSKPPVAILPFAPMQPDTNSFVAKQLFQKIKVQRIARLQASPRKHLAVNSLLSISAQPVAVTQPDTGNFVAKTIADKKQRAQKITVPRIARLPAGVHKRFKVNATPLISPEPVAVTQPDTGSFIAKVVRGQQQAREITAAYITHIPAIAPQALSTRVRPVEPLYVQAAGFTPQITDTIPEPFIPFPPYYDEENMRPAPVYIAPIVALAGQEFAAPVTYPVMQATLLQEPVIPVFRDTAATIEEALYAGKEDTALQPHKVNSSKYRWAVSLGIASASNNRTITEQGDYQFIKHYRDSTDKRLTSFNYSAGLHYNVSERLRLDVGVGVNKAGERINTRQVVYKTDSLTIIPTGHIVILSSPPVITVAGKAYYDINNDSAGHINNSLSYLSLSGGCTYFMQPGKKFRIGLQPAFAASKLFASNEYYYRATDSTYHKARRSQLSSWMFSATFGVPFEYSFTPRFILSVTPYYTAFLSPVYASEQTITKQYRQSGIRLSFAWMFR